MKTNITRFGPVIFVCLMVFLLGNLDQTTKDALKVQHLLRTIERHKPDATGAEQSAEVSEKELNAYITYRLKQENDPIVKGLKVGLIGNDQVKGKLNLDAAQMNLDFLVGKVMNIDFQGKVHSRNGKGRIAFSAFHLNGQVVEPSIMELVIKAAGRAYGTTIGGTDEWYELPQGVNRLDVKKDKVILYY